MSSKKYSISSLFVKTWKERLLQQSEGSSLDHSREQLHLWVLCVPWVLHLGLQSKPRPSLNPCHLSVHHFYDLLPRAHTELLCNLGHPGNKQLSLNLNPYSKEPTLSVHVPPILLLGTTEQQPPVSVEFTYCLTHTFLSWQGAPKHPSPFFQQLMP